MRFTHLHQIAVSATDFDASVAFYADVLNLDLIRRFEEPIELAFFDLGGPRLMIEKGTGTTMFYLGVEDIDSSVASIVDAGFEIVEEPRVIYTDADGSFGLPGESEWMAFVRDPGGNLVGLVQRK